MVGLGNPERVYEKTRHNVGFMVADEIATRLDVRFREGTGEYLIAEKKYAGDQIVLVKPTTHMNNSGFAVRDVVDKLDVDLSSLLVICDDFNLPIGTIRIRLQGSDGGHHGLASIIERLGSIAFPRLRCGIQSKYMPQDRAKLADFVLDVFAEDEHPTVKMMIKRAADACLQIPLKGIHRVMNEFNQ